MLIFYHLLKDKFKKQVNKNKLNMLKNNPKNTSLSTFSFSLDTPKNKSNINVKQGIYNEK